jgi:hypothetical protein
VSAAPSPQRPHGDRTPISAVVITAGQSPYLSATLASLAWCDEVLVLVSHHVETVRQLPEAACCRIETHPFDGYGAQKRRAVNLASHDWILSLDDDERLDDAAIAALQSQDLSAGPASYTLRRRTFVGDQEILHGPWGHERVVRLFHRDRCEIADLKVHEAVRSQEPAERLSGSILHHSFADCGEILTRSIHYARLKSQIIREKNEATHIWMLPLRGLVAFLKSYVLQQGFRDGAAGFAIALSRIVDSTLPRMLLLGSSVRDDADAPPPPACPQEAVPRA